MITKWKIVITQPAAGVFKAFTASCPHRGCAVGRVGDGVIRCPCTAASSPSTRRKRLKGPAEAPLAQYALKVEGDGIIMV